jgi:hypothetical protein
LIFVENLATVITSLASAIPVVGGHIVEWLWGGFSVNNPTLNRFYSLHYLFPFLLAALSLVHLAALHQNGSTNPLGISAQTDLIDFYPYFYTKDLVATLALAAFAAFLVGFYPEALGHPDNNIPANPYSTPAHIVPEYYCSLLSINRLLKNPIRCEKHLTTKEMTAFYTVKRFFLNGKFAREEFLNDLMNQIPVKNIQGMPSLQRLNIGHPYGFIYWFCGFIDGDGCFHFCQNKNDSWTFSLQINQSNYNLKLLAYLKTKLKCGSIKKHSKNASVFYLKNPDLLYHYLLPKLPDAPFLTRKKAWQFNCFKKALAIYIQAKNKTISAKHRDSLLNQLKLNSKEIPPHFDIKHPLNDKNYPPTGWIIGFTEAEGSFYLNQQTEKTLIHTISWAQNDEKTLLETIRQKFSIKAKLSIYKKKNFECYKLATTNQETIKRIIPFFENKMKGMKAVEFKKWARSFRKDRKNFAKLQKIRLQIRQTKNHTSLQQ